MTFTSEGSNSTSVVTTVSTGAGSAVADFDVKAHFGQEIRRFKLPLNVRLGQLQAHIQTLFSVAPQSPLALLYRDNENDLVTMTLDEELAYAIAASNGLLRLEVRQPQAPVPVTHMDAVPPKPWRKFQQGRHEPHPGQGAQYLEQFPTLRGGNFYGGICPNPASEAQSEPDRGRGRGRGECSNKLQARHVKDITVADGTVVQPGVPFVKTWRIRNAGTVNWPERTRLIFISHKGDHMGGPEFVCIEGIVQAGAEVDVSVNLMAPQQPGDYSGFWRMCTEDGKKFGQRFWVSITVTKPQEGGEMSSSENSGLEQVPVPSEYERFLKQIQDMGFTDVPKRRIERLLCKFGGNVDTVVAKLNARRERAAKNKEARGCGNKKL